MFSVACDSLSSMLAKSNDFDWSRASHPASLEHINYMLSEIRKGMEAGKAERWLGWIACALLISATNDKSKSIVKKFAHSTPAQRSGSADHFFVRDAARECDKLIKTPYMLSAEQLWVLHDADTHYILNDLICMQMIGNAANFFLGWCQCSIVIAGIGTLESMKSINSSCSR